MMAGAKIKPIQLALDACFHFEFAVGVLVGVMM